jgi:hypothetical protein
VAIKPSVHVKLREDGWAVIREGNERVISVHETQDEAEKAGRGIARTEQIEFSLHGEDGQIRARTDYRGARVVGKEEEGTNRVQNSAQPTQEQTAKATGGQGTGSGNWLKDTFRKNAVPKVLTLVSVLFFIFGAFVNTETFRTTGAILLGTALFFWLLFREQDI